MFNPNHLYYCGRQQGIDVFLYNGVRISAVIADERDGQYLYLGLGKGLGGYELPGLLDWFGINRHRYFAEYEFPDKSYYLVQKRAA